MYQFDFDSGVIFDPVDGQVIATTSESATPEQARLLAAAPRLLAALQGLLAMPEYDGTADTSKTRLRAKQGARRAIHAAKGA